MRNILFLFLVGFAVATPVQGVTVKSRGFTLGISAYLDFEYTHMSKMPMAQSCSEANPCMMKMGSSMMSMTGGSMVMDMNEMSVFDQNHLNLIFSGRYKKTRTQINLESRHGFSTYDGNSGAPGRSSGNGSDDNVGSFRVAEAYGDHQFAGFLNLRVGNFYAPFGIYNSIRFATPMFATVVLPYMYEMPPNYSGQPLIPQNGNFMLHGNLDLSAISLNYSLYANQGTRWNNNSGRLADKGHGHERDNSKGYGSRLKFGLMGHSFGMSHYTYQPATTTVNAMGMMETIVLDRSAITGADVDLFLPAGIHFQAEYAMHDVPAGDKENDKSKTTYYARVMYEAGKYIPFIMYDVFEDPQDAIYKHVSSRIGVGLGAEIEKNFYFKTEYHYHSFKDDLTGQATAVNSVSGRVMKMSSKSESKTQNMVRSSFIFYF